MNTRHPGRPKKEGPWGPCKFAGCEKTIEGGSRGFCHTHYIAARRGRIDMKTGQQLREPMRVTSYGPDARCSVDGCERRPFANSLCSGHLQRQRAGIALDIPLRPKGSRKEMVLCLVADCERRAHSRGMCGNHAAQRAGEIIDDQGNKLREPYSMGRGRPRRKERWESRDGYVLVKAPSGHPRARVDGSILEHRLVMEQALGRVLEDWEIVHHKDGNRANNKIENLELMDGRARHGIGHPPGSEFDAMTAVQVLLQQRDLPKGVEESLLLYRDQKTS